MKIGLDEDRTNAETNEDEIKECKPGNGRSEDRIAQERKCTRGARELLVAGKE